MRVAVPTCGGVFNQHFGRSDGFWICDVQGEPPAISESRVLSLAPGGGCGAIPVALSQAGVTLVIAGGMGGGAVANLTRHGIEAIAGVPGGEPRQIVEDYLAGKLTSTGQFCQEHENHGGHGHGHQHGHAGSCHREE